MHILNTVMSIDPVLGGGTAERTFQLCRHLAASGARCTLLTLDIGLTAERMRALEGVEVTALPCINQRFYVPLAPKKIIARLVAAADVVHLMNHWTLLNAMVYRETVRQGKPYAVCPAGALPVFGRSGPLKRLYNRCVGRALIAGALRFVAITEREIPQYMAYGGRRERTVVIPNGIDAAEYQARDDAGFRKRHQIGDGPLILFVGRLNPIKGPDLLLDAFLGLAGDPFPRPPATLCLVGPDGGLLEALRARVDGRGGCDRVRFIGYLGGKDKSIAYHAADLLVIPSRQEAMSIVALEAGICGTPVLLTDQCGFDQVDDVGGGMVVPASVAGLTRGLSELLGDPAGMIRRGAALQAYVSRHYPWDRIAQQHVAMFREITATRRSA